MFLVSLQRNSQPLCQINEIIRKNESQKRAHELFHPYIFCYLLYGSYFDSESHTSNSLLMNKLVNKVPICLADKRDCGLSIDLHH